MKRYKPAYYDSFHCLAGSCPDTCCQQWDIQVDPETVAFYKTVPGNLGEKIRSALREEDGETILSLVEDHCPLQEPGGLCSVQAALGEQALCRVCRTFPRLTHDYGDFVELGLELSCPEAARLLLTDSCTEVSWEEIPGGTEPDYDADAMELLLSSRKTAYALLNEKQYSAEEALSLLFFYGVHVQAALDGEDPGAFDPAVSLETAFSMKKEGSLQDLCQVFLDLEILTPQWKALLGKAREAPLSPLCRNLCRYFVGRYWLQAVSDYDLYCRVKFMLIASVLLSSLPGDFLWNAHLFSREIENDIDNVDALLDAAYGDPAFTDDKLLGFLLRTCKNGKV